MQYIENAGDRLVSDGTFTWTGPGGMLLKTENFNNHQQTYGVLAAALSALHDYMSTVSFGPANFNIFDGGIEVAQGAIG